MSVALGIFGRAPIAGRAKTRLIPALGADGAASLYAAMLQDVLRMARSLEECALTFWSADDAASPQLDACLDGIERRVQCAGDLGARMRHALDAGLRNCDCALLIGSDVPTLTAAVVRQATRALAESDVVLASAEDGGYTLIGARRTHPAMFEGVTFSRSDTRLRTEHACRAAGLRVARIDGGYDVDTPEDLARLADELRAAPRRAAETARWLVSQLRPPPR